MEYACCIIFGDNETKTSGYPPVNMKKSFLFIWLILLAANNLLLAQPAPSPGRDTLPDFTVKNAGNNRIIIGWVNNYSVVKQIGIQRSFDSLLNYKTILTVPDPMAVQNGYMDAKATNDHMFYRLYILLENGKYLFSAAKKPVPDTFHFRSLHAKVTEQKVLPNRDTFMLNGQLVMVKTDTIVSNGKPVIVRAKPVVIKLGEIQWGDSIASPNPQYNKTRVEAFKPSLRVFTNRDGYVRINLPEEEKSKKYSIKFFEDDNTFLFELKELKEHDFKLDKTNFYHAGWFRFELYENGKLLEKYKFYLEKDF